MQLHNKILMNRVSENPKSSKLLILFHPVVVITHQELHG